MTRSSSWRFLLSSAPFDLSEESVVVALQCYIGGSSPGFWVSRISDHKFRFSVASNKVEHFIYKLYDRIWPDFVCHFLLFKPSVVDHIPSSWEDDEAIQANSVVCPMAIKPNLHALRISAQNDSSSSKELVKFGLSREGFAGRNLNGAFDRAIPETLSAYLQAVSTPPMTTPTISFGRFVCPVQSLDLRNSDIIKCISSPKIIEPNHSGIPLMRIFYIIS